METYQDLLPPYVQGWFLLQDAGLEPQERIMVMSALKDNFHVDRVSQELRNQWSDEDLRRKDQSGRGSAWSAEPQEEDDPWLQGDKSSPDLSLLVGDGLSEEGIMMINEAEDEAQQALMMMDRGRRTLREARAKQNYVKKSRQFYRSESSYKPSFRQGQTTGRQEPSDPGTRCLSCGGTGHKTSMCPKKGNASTATTEESAPFVCYTETQGQDQAYVTGGGITTREAMEQGKAIIDGGATRTLGSVTAIESVMGLNQQSFGEDGLKKLDPSERPVFGFGNSSSDQCLSTAWLKVQAAGKEVPFTGRWQLREELSLDIVFQTRHSLRNMVCFTVPIFREGYQLMACTRSLKRNDLCAADLSEDSQVILKINQSTQAPQCFN